MSSARAFGSLQLLRGLAVDRNRPDLPALAAEASPERFVWRVLPHAARSFAASIVVLPPEQARAAAVTYLYCRMLDTYEDLVADPEDCAVELERFASRFDSEALPAPSTLPDDCARDERDRVYLLLIARCGEVDAVYRTLPADVRARIGDLVRAMAEGMARSTRQLARQGGVLLDQEQLGAYCRNVIGHPAVFTLRLVGPGELDDRAREDAFAVSEMIQLANVTRDIERDLARGIAYHPALGPYLGDPAPGPAARDVIREVREELLAMALQRAPSYRRLYERMNLGAGSAVRTAALLMLLFTDLHYRACALSTGHPSWPGPRGRLAVVAAALPALISRRWAGREIRRVENDFAAASARLGGDLRRAGFTEPASRPAGASTKA